MSTPLEPLPRAVPTSKPRVSVVILSHERRDLLRRTLDSVLGQDVDSFEVIVVDNGSRDGSVQMIREEFASVRLVALNENTGIRGRNVGFELATADVVLSLDDDIELLRPDTMRRVAEAFERNPTVGALTLKICEEPDRDEFAKAHWWHPLPRERFQNRSFATDHLSEAAVAFRTPVLRGAGCYYEPLFWGGEEWDLSLSIWDAGFEIHYLPEPVLHLAPRGSLNQRADPRHALLVRNRCWIASRRLPFPAAIAYIVPRLALWFFRSVRHGYFDEYLTGLRGLASNLPRIVRDRRPISRGTYQRLRDLRRQRQAS